MADSVFSAFLFFTFFSSLQRFVGGKRPLKGERWRGKGGRERGKERYIKGTVRTASTYETEDLPMMGGYVPGWPGMVDVPYIV